MKTYTCFRCNSRGHWASS
ncbi:MAG: hypothetical protein JSV32_01885 [Dehalococcoidia bacterium]|nr:MAG: hypothetical protein JSV32_01885 [Dehalococcoidia bacterium]